MKQKRSSLKIVLGILRWGLCAVAVVYLYNNVNWHDYVRLQDDSLVRMVDQNEASVTILRDGQPITLPNSETRIEDGVPEIHFGFKSIATKANITLAILSVLLFLPVPLLQSIRLVWMLAIQDVRVTFWEAIKLSYAGNFFNFALPGTTGGDLVKAYYVTKYTHHKTEAVTTIFLDRIIGLLGLMIVASVTVLIAFNRIDWDPQVRTSVAGVFGLVWIGLAVGCFFLFSKRLRHMIRLPQIAAKLPAGEQLLRIGRATVAMRSHKGLVLLSLANTVILQLFVVISAWVMALALGMKGGADVYFICVPIGFLLSAVPFTPPQGFGVMEWAYVQFFTTGGLDNRPAQAVAFALAIRLIQLVWALPGVLVPLLGAHLPSRSELEAFEESTDDDGGTESAVDYPTPQTNPAVSGE
ncbi:MAG: flippase-like domain-containing protein [Phycisphaerales bacterium]|nr:flippase-like domain-containing protein [Phycisphaerales bacterium]